MSATGYAASGTSTRIVPAEWFVPPQLAIDATHVTATARTARPLGMVIVATQVVLARRSATTVSHARTMSQMTVSTVITAVV